jgi:hypothetical protein
MSANHPAWRHPRPDWIPGRGARDPAPSAEPRNHRPAPFAATWADRCPQEPYQRGSTGDIWLILPESYACPKA